MTGDATEPLAVVGDPGRALPGQIARFGELAGRDRWRARSRRCGSAEPTTRGATATPGPAGR